ncbi:actin-related protein [Crepidotus variabilis]|uniref:Actin-related protein n=1 Tax=Crepidotus variabilis TaxID=179855 RepID=A0A9P6JMZ5_9AGAR|nr:actin-related protein [Crepidotus variabilis]
MSIRDANVVVIEVSRTSIRAGIGLHDLLKTPAVEFPARVGIRRDASTNVEEKMASTSRAGSMFPQRSIAKAAVKDYLVGQHLDDALARGEDLIISYPFAEGDISDFTQAEAIWKHILFTHLQRRRLQNESPVLLSIFSGLARTTYERICQVFFERFNVAGFGILERPMAQLYAANNLSGVVVDVGEEFTDISPIYDGYIVHPACTSVPIGTKHCENYLANILKANQGVVNALSPADNPLDPETLHQTLLSLVSQMVKDDLIKVPSDGETAAPEDEGVTDIAAVVVAGREKAVIESGMKKKANAKASAADQARAREIELLDLIEVKFGDHTLTIGKERHRLCEPLFDPSLLNGVYGIQDFGKEKVLSLQYMVGHAIGQTEIEQRQYIWQGLLITGEVTRHVKGVGIALQSRVAPFIINPEISTDIQPRSTRVLNVPDFFAEYRETGNGYAAFLGSSITAKIIFAESSGTNFVSKADYTVGGPHSIIEKTPALL